MQTDAPKYCRVTREASRSGDGGSDTPTSTSEWHEAGGRCFVDLVNAHTCPNTNCKQLAKPSMADQVNQRCARAACWMLCDLLRRQVLPVLVSRLLSLPDKDVLVCRRSPLDMLAQDKEEDLKTLLAWIRYAAALQPDATRLPAERCQASVMAPLGTALASAAGSCSGMLRWQNDGVLVGSRPERLLGALAGSLPAASGTLHSKTLLPPFSTTASRLPFCLRCPWLCMRAQAAWPDLRPTMRRASWRNWRPWWTPPSCS